MTMPLNYFLLIAKLYLWDRRRNQTFPIIYGFKAKIEVKNETELYIAQKSNKMGFLQSKWAFIQYFAMFSCKQYDVITDLICIIEKRQYL